MTGEELAGTALLVLFVVGVLWGFWSYARDVLGAELDGDGDGWPFSSDTRPLGGRRR